ncbi:hypothetical protein L249_7008 [Ophiocordyceps polyrhachis-furcata BCC 54312]|uniref:FAD-binding PCMH-type domain-containing protein n=1 Tax=Ophiocordyceps polyrhachis-furcata BCC 54312 TaxID=1330021 RepID=A0A367LL29_9HYPO|nr:hypothetical protein L249_7008 [Ophiocordyceps polyrhachis-furcata BCC 54312]
MKHGYVIAAAGLASSVDGHRTASLCCNRLSHHVPSLYQDPSSARYEQLINARWSNNSILHPACVVTPKSADDVSRTIRLLAAYRCDFSVKGGGHNANPGANSIDDGVSIDLASLDSAYLASDRSYVSLGAGISYGKAYDLFNDTNVGFVGGLHDGISAGGLSLGGGTSLFQASRGWAVDNILNYEVVLSCGTIVNANQKSNADLFKALKGGNTNFGIVTRVDFKTFEFKGLWDAEVVVSLKGPQVGRSEMLDKISRTMVDFVANNDKDVATSIHVAVTYVAAMQAELAILAITNSDNVENPALGRPARAVPNQRANVARHGKVANYVHAISRFQTKGSRQVTATLTISNDYDTLREIWDASDMVYDELPQKVGVQWIVQIFAQPKIQQSYSMKHGGNSLGLANVKDDQLVIWLTARWNNTSFDGMMDKAQKRFVQATEAVARKHGTLSPFLYINFAGYFQNPLCGYGPESVAHLRKVARKYDARRVFQHLMKGGFKISQADCGGRYER